MVVANCLGSGLDDDFTAFQADTSVKGYLPRADIIHNPTQLPQTEIIAKPSFG